MQRLKILIVDDSDTIRLAIRTFLQSEGHEVIEADCCKAALEACARAEPDVSVIDYQLPDGTALDLLRKFREGGSGAPVIVLTAHASIDLAVRAIKEGAEQFLTKPLELPALLLIIRRVTEGQRTRRREAAVRASRRPDVDPFVGTSAAIQRLHEEARMVLGSESSVLITGPTGSGKGVLARWLHASSSRADEAFVDLNCAGLSPTFLESELFGHERGAFTGAVAAKQGLFEVAHRGTLFLDEIGDVDQAVQPKLLKVLEERRFRRLGEVRDRVVDVRLLAATHQDLGALIRERKFRSDLYFRVSTLPLSVPPLSDRVEDIPVLARCLIETIAADLGRKGLALSDAGARALQGYSWPGNVRELRNVLERASLLCRGAAIEPGDLRFAEVRAGDGPAAMDVAAGGIVSLAENERRYLEHVLRSTGGRVDEAAKALGLPRSSMYDRLKRHGLSPKA